MIYDNYSERERFQPLLPRRNKGNIIYTSRSQGYLSDLPAECVSEVKPLEEKEATSLLLKIANREEAQLSAEEFKAAQEIVVEVGCLPLAIESAGAYLKEGECSALAYLRMFRDRRNRPELLKNPHSDPSLPGQPAVYTALDLSYDAILALRRRNGRNPKGRDAQYALQVLNILCFYHNEGIPFSMMKRAAEQRREEGGELYEPFCDLAEDPFMDATDILKCGSGNTWISGPFYRGLDMLQRFSLAMQLPQRNQVSMHVIVQSWAQDRMKEPTRCRQALVARIVLLESVRPGWNRADQSWLEHIPRHVNACLAHQATAIRHGRYQADLDFKLGWYYKEQKEFSSAEEYFQKALRFLKFEHGAHSWSITRTLLFLGDLYLDMGRAGDAEFACQEALERIRARNCDLCDELERLEVREKDRKRRADRRQKLILLFQSGQGNSKNSGNGVDEKGLLWRFAAVRRPKVVTEAIMTTLKEADPKSWNIDISWAYSGLYRVLLDQGRPMAAAESLRAAIRFMTRAYHPEHVEVMLLKDEYIRQFEKGGDISHWDQRFNIVQSFSEQKYERYVCHEYSFILLIGHARSLMEIEYWAEAYAIYEIQLQLARELYGVADRRTLYVMRSMALCQLKQGSFEEAEEIARAAVEQAKASYGQWHIRTAKCLIMLSRIIAQYSAFRGPGTAFFAVVEEAYDSVRFAFAEDHPLAVTLKNSLEYHRSPVPDDEDDVPGQLDPFFEHMDRILEEHKPETREERMAMVEREYREFARKKLQDKVEENRLKIQREAGADCGAEGAQREEDGATGVKMEPRRQKKWKGKEKACATLSPIPETEPAFQEEGREGSENIAEALQQEREQDEVEGQGNLLPLPAPGAETAP